MAFSFYSSFCKCAKIGRKIRKTTTKKLSQFLKSHISGTLKAISLKFGMWSAEVGGGVHSKNRLVSSRQHRTMEVRKLRFLSSCQYTHGCCAPASWATRHTTVCLNFANNVISNAHFNCEHCIPLLCMYKCCFFCSFLCSTLQVQL